MKDIRKDSVDQIVIDELDEIFSKTGLDELADSLIKRMKEMSTEIPGELINLKKSLIKLDKQIDSLVDAIAEGLYSPSIKEKLETLELQKQNVTDKIDFLEERMNLVKLPDKDYIYSFFEKDMNIKNKTKDEQKRIIQTYINKVVVYPEYIEVYTNLSDANNRKGIRKGTVQLHCSYPLPRIFIISTYLYEQPINLAFAYKKLDMKYL